MPPERDVRQHVDVETHGQLHDSFPPLPAVSRSCMRTPKLHATQPQVEAGAVPTMPQLDDQEAADCERQQARAARKRGLVPRVAPQARP